MDSSAKTTLIDVDFGEEIVISGIAGRFPKSDNMKHLQENLLNKMDLGTDDCRRWLHESVDIPKRTGKINNIDKFDAEYFDIPFHEAHLLDPMSRCLLEHTYEAIIDAGVNPKNLRGMKTGVIVGVCYSETEKTHIYEKTQVAGLGGLGCKRSMLANRISYWLGVTGPSCTIDSACSSSIYNIEQAYRNIRSGKCDDMIVAGSNLCLNPLISLQYARLGVLSPDGFCKPFDMHANGYMRSEAIAVIYLQKAKNAKRIYATVIHSKTNCDGFKEQGITFPSTEMQSVLLQQVYDECNVSPSDVVYVDTHGTGTQIGDSEEVNAIEKIFCKDRRSPLLIGSSKSNIGHTEPVSGLLQIFKMVIAMETGVIPPNINLTQERNNIEAFKKGTIRVVTTLTPWKPTFVGINSFGFGGANAHLLLAPNMKQKINGGAPKDDFPRLVVLSGRTKQAVQSFLYEIERQPIDVEYVRLLHDLYADDMKDHHYRSYTIIESQKSGNAINEIQHYSGVRKLICFMFSGIGSQWFGMGEALLRFPAFSETVKKCDAILRPREMHIIDILTKKHEIIFDSILNSIMGIIVMQLGLIELLISVNVMPDYVIGYSIGELCCGYMTGDFTIEQVIISAYYIGLVLEETKLHYTTDIGLDYKNEKNMYSPDMKINKIFFEEINCGNISLDSCYLVPARDRLLAYLYQVIPQKIIHRHMWRGLIQDTDLSYAEYFTNNLINSVFFEEITKLIHESAVLVEIAPDGIQQSALNKLFDVTNITLSQRNHENNVKVFLQGLGKIYNCGLQPQLANLYPTVEFPVSRGTPMISPSIKWEHSKDWYVTSYKQKKQITTGEIVFNISLQDEDYKYMSGHVIDGRNLLPATGYIVLIWKMIGIFRMELYNNVPIVFEDVKFLKATLFSNQAAVTLTLLMQKGTGEFEIIDGSNAIVTGRVRVPLNPDKEKTSIDHLQRDDDEEEVMKTRDIYKEFKLRGYEYDGLFRGLKSSSITGSRGHIAWMNNWTVFMDNMLQIRILGMDTRNLCVLTEIQKLVIIPNLHAQHIKSTTFEDKQLTVRVYKDLNIIISGGVEIHGVKTTYIFRRKLTAIPILEEYKFIAHRDGAKISFEDGLILSTQLVLEHHHTSKVDIIELLEDGNEMIIQKLASPVFTQILTNLPLIRPNITVVKKTNCFDHVILDSKIKVLQSKKLLKKGNVMLVTGCNLLTKSKNKTLIEILSTLKANGFLLTRGQSLTEKDLIYAEMNNLTIIFEKHTEKEHLTLLKKRVQLPNKTEVIYVNNYEFSWLEQLKSMMNAENELTNATRIILVEEKNKESGLLGFVNCLKKEPGGELIRGVFIQDENAQKFSLHNPFYAKQLQMDLFINVLRPGKIWGSYKHFPLAPLKSKLVHQAFVNQMVPGDLTSLRWIEGPIALDCQDKNLINIIYASLNFKDIMIATGKINMQDMLPLGQLEECMIGSEYAGIDDVGRRVMGIHKNKCISNRQIVDKFLSWEIPSEWTLEDAATVPCVYSTCYYGLCIMGKLKKGDKILIHSGAGAVGQAAIHIALHVDCEVFTTVGTSEKQKFIRNIFPSIPESHIGNSHNTSFEHMIYQQTDGRGVDIVLNSLAEDKFQASVRCLARRGRFLEIGQFDMMINNTLDISVFSKEIQFHSVMLNKLFYASNEKKRYLNTILSTGLDNGVVKPIIRKVFQKDEIETAFKYMLTGNHIGKIIIKIQEEKKPIDVPIFALPRYYCLSNKSYIILGGLGGFGIEMAHWLIIRGAKNLVLISRTGIKNGYQRMKIEQWKSYGVKVLIISNVDASNVKECEYILRTAEELAPIDAIFNVAVVLKDKVCQNHTVETFQIPFKAKAWATKNLDQLSRKICPQLRHFVVFSSISCGKGNVGQTNYGMANSSMERICEKRSQEGLHGLAIQWGAIDDVGVLTDMEDNVTDTFLNGTLQQKISSCIEKLEEFLLQKQPIVSSIVVAEKDLDIVNTINVADTVAKIMGLKDMSLISGHIRLPELGMDSFMAVEIKQTLEREYRIFLTAQDIRNLNFAKLDKLNKMFNQETHLNKKLHFNNALDANDLIGLNVFVRTMNKGYSLFDYMGSKPDVCMNLSTKSNKAESDIFLLPGIEGCGGIFDFLVPKIKAPTMYLQYGAYNIGNNYQTITEIANCVLKHMLDKIKLRKYFVIVAYSYGSLIGIELVRKLEEMKLQGRLVLIDGAPELVKSLAKQHMPYTTTDELHNNVLLSIMDLLNPVVNRKLLLELNKCSNWDNKLNIFINHLPEKYKKLSIDFTRALCVTIYNHIHAIHEYDITQIPKIMSPIILLKPTEPSLRLLDEDYGLHKITVGNIQVHYVEGNHATILDNNKVVAVINEQMKLTCERNS